MPVYTQQSGGVAILDGATGATLSFLDPEEGDYAAEGHRLGWLRDETFWMLRAKRGPHGRFPHVLDLFEVSSSGARLIHRSEVLDTGGEVFPYGMDEDTGELTIVESTGHLVTRDRNGVVLRRAVFAEDGGSAVLDANGLHVSVPRLRLRAREHEVSRPGRGGLVSDGVVRVDRG